MSLAKRALGLPKTDIERKKIISFLNSYYNEDYSSVEYTGKSKKIFSKQVVILNELKNNKIKIEDELGNTATVSKNMIKYIK
jgi:hypothetical protein